MSPLPGVVAVGTIDNTPLNTLGTQTIDVNVDGVAPPPGRETHSADRALVTPGVFEALGIRIVQGRNFDEHRDVPASQPVAIICEAMARKFWPERDGVGRMIRRPAPPDLLVVGVASDTKVRSFGEAPRSMVYQLCGAPHNRTASRSCDTEAAVEPGFRLDDAGSRPSGTLLLFPVSGDRAPS